MINTRDLHPSLSTKLTLILVGMVLATSASTLLIINVVVQQQEEAIDQHMLQAQQRALPPPLAFLAADPDHSLPVVSPDGVIAGYRAELAQGASVDHVLSEMRGQLAYAQSVPVAFQTVASVLADPQSRLPRPSALALSELILGPLRPPLAVSILVMAVLAALVSLVLARTIARPLRDLQAASARIAAGNYDLAIRPQGDKDMSRLAVSFNRMAETLRNAERLRKEQLANMTHELRTPLTAIQGYTEALRDGLIDSAASRTELYTYILSEVRYMTAMVKSLREWSNAAARLEKLHLEPHPAAGLLGAVTDRFRIAAQQKAITLTVVETPAALVVLADADVFRTILGNILDNAVHYTPEGGTITVSVRSQTDTGLSLQRPRWAVFAISDSGVGIPADDVPFVFERFYRVDKSRTRETGGTGLGLALVRDAVHALGGDVALTSTVERGTTVTFSLPLADD